MVGVIIQAITGYDGVSYTREQLSVCVRNGLRIAGYVWCFPGAPASSMRSRLAMFDGYKIEFLALDVEQAGLTKADVDRDLKLCDTYIKHDGGTWIYSGKWFFDQQGWSRATWWSPRKLWDSNYDGIPVAEANFRPYHGWTECQIKQYKGTSVVGSVNMVDLNVAA